MIRLLLVSSFFLVVSCQPRGFKYNYIQEETGAIGDTAMVATGHHLATKIGLEVLKNGGNAFDAAIAVKFALAVVFPRAGNIGGGGFLVYRLYDGSIGGLDFREKAPLMASREMYLDKNREVVSKLSMEGHLAAGVPGAVDAMFQIHKRFASKSVAELIQPAIKLAYYGFEISKDQADIFNRFQEVFQKYNGDNFLFLKEWDAGDTLIQKDLAGTLTQIRDHGRDGFYGGIVADQIVKEIQSGGGLISKEDLKNYQAKWREPVIGTYRDHKIISMSPPSSGGIALIQLLKGAEKYDISELGFNSAETIHIKTELERRVFADRATHLGDPDYYDVPVRLLTSDSYNKKRFSDIRKNKKTDSQEIKEGNVEIIESVETTHFSILDAEGNAVAITTTLNSFMGCKVMVDGAGFFLNNEMDDFSSKPGVPNQFGMVGGEANAIVPEKRMLSNMTPTILEKDGQLKMILGTPGGSTIITSIFQVIMNVIDHGMTMQDAINAPRVHSQWLPDIIVLEENGVHPEVIKSLRDVGHVITTKPKMGSMDCILVRADSTLEGGADYRRYMENYAEGY